MSKKMIKKQFVCLECGNTGRTYINPKLNAKEGAVIKNYCSYCDKDSNMLVCTDIDMYKAKISLIADRTELEEEVLNLLEKRKEFNGRIR